MDDQNPLNVTKQTLAKQIHAFADKPAPWNAEDEATWKRLNDEYDANQAKIEAENKESAKIEAKRAEITARLTAIDAAPGAERRQIENIIGRDGGRLLEDSRRDRGQQPDPNADFAMALQGWFRFGAQGAGGEVTNKHHEAAKRLGVNIQLNEFRVPLIENYAAFRSRFNPRNTLVTTQTPGSLLFGSEFVTQLEEAMLWYGGMYQVAEVMRTQTGVPMGWPTANDTGNTGYQVGENPSSISTADPTAGAKQWGAYVFSSKEILVSFQLLRDTPFNLVQILARMLGERLGRIKNTKFTNGSGANTPYGITTLAASGVTAASQTAIVWDELIDLEHTIDLSRRGVGCGYMFHDSLCKAFRKLKDGNGRPLWQEGPNTGTPDTLNRYPFYLNNDMASAMTAGATTVLFGQLSAYKIRDVGEIRMYRLVEKYREQDSDAFLSFSDSDGNLLDAGDNPVKKLVQA